MEQNIFKRLRSGDVDIIAPYNLKSLSRAARYSQQAYQDNFSCFYNVPERSQINDDALFIGIVISRLKKMGGMRGIRQAIRIVDVLEEDNAF